MARNISVALTLDDRDFQQGFARADRTVDNFTRGLAPLRAGLVGLFSGLAVGALTRGLVDAYTQFERTRTVLATLLGSQQAANSEFARLQVLANALPQDLQDISDAFVILSRNGIGTTNRELTNFSNIATASGRSMTQLAEAVADAMTGQFERLKEFGIKITKQNDTLVASVGGQQAFVAQNAQDLVRQLEALGQTRFGDAAANNAGTLDQSLSNLRGTVYEVTIAFMEGLAPALKLSADNMAEFVKHNKTLITEMGVGLGQALSAVVNSLHLMSAALTVVRDAVLAYVAVALFRNLQSSIAYFNSTSNAARSLSAVVGRLSAAFVKFARGLPVIGLIMAPFTAGTAAATAFVVSMVSLGVAFRTFEDRLFSVGGVVTSLGEIFDALTLTITQGFAMIGPALTELARKTQSVISVIADSFSESFIGDAVIQSVKALLEAIKIMINFSIGAFKSLGQVIVDTFQAIPAIFDLIFGTIAGLLYEFISRAGRQFGEFWDFIATGGTDSIENAFTGMADNIAGYVSTEMDKISRAFEETSDIADTLTFDYLASGADAAAESLAGMIKNLREVNRQSSEVDNLEIEMGVVARRPPQAGTPMPPMTTDKKKSRTQMSDLALFTDTVRRETEVWSKINKEAEDQRNALFQEYAYIRMDLLGQEEQAKQRLVEQQKLLQELYAQGIITSEEEYNILSKKAELYARLSSGAGTFTEGWRAAFDDFKRQVEDTAAFGAQMFSTFTNGLTDAIMTFVETGKLSFRSLIQDMMREILRMMVNKIVMNFMGMMGGGGGFFGSLFGGARAEGGPVSANRAYMVGERGPELFMPRGSGHIVPTDQLGGGVRNTNVTYNIQAVDARSFRDLVARDPEFIYAVSQAGARRVPG